MLHPWPHLPLAQASTGGAAVITHAPSKYPAPSTPHPLPQASIDVDVSSRISSSRYCHAKTPSSGHHLLTPLLPLRCPPAPSPDSPSTSAPSCLDRNAGPGPVLSPADIADLPSKSDLPSSRGPPQSSQLRRENGARPRRAVGCHRCPRARPRFRGRTMQTGWSPSSHTSCYISTPASHSDQTT